METRDADSLYDTRRRAESLQVMVDKGLSFMDLLRKVDKTFERHPTDLYTAVNSRGYEVDLIRRFPPPDMEASEHPLQMASFKEDLCASRVCMGERLLSVPKLSQVVVGHSGSIARMPTVQPLAFACIKRLLAKEPNGDPRKAPRMGRRLTSWSRWSRSSCCGTRPSRSSHHRVRRSHVGKSIP